LRQVLTGILIALVLALLIGMGAGLLLLVQQNQTLRAQLDESRAHSANLQAQLDRRDDELRQLRTEIDALKAQVDALTQQLRDVGLEPSKVMSPQNIATMDTIEQDVRDIRGLSATRPVTRTLLTSEELRQYVIDLQEKNYTRQDADEFASAYREYLTARFNRDGPTRTEGVAEWWIGSTTTYFAQVGDRTLIVVGPDETTVQSAVSVISE